VSVNRTTSAVSKNEPEPVHSFLERAGRQFSFGAESFNLTNTPNYFVANNQNDAATRNAVQGSGFGKIVTTNPNYTPRTLQFAVKLLF
jgi:hypothetical protein